MVFNLILLVLTGAVAFFHYVQGFFSATISVICAAIAAVVALGWYEQVAPFLFSIKFYDQAASISLVVLFAAAYIIPRVLIDSMIPGNIRLPVIADKIGASVMGLIAGLLCTGIAAVAADALPFSPTIGMYSRFSVSDQQGEYMGRSQYQDVTMNDVLQSDTIDADDPGKQRLWFGQADFVVALEKKVSDGGSLATDQSFSAAHPDLLDEYYGQRLGIQPGGGHSAVSTDANRTVDVKGVFTPAKPVPQVDGQVASLRKTSETLPATIQADGDHVVLIVRMTVGGKDLADDADNLLRYSTGAVRLVAGEPDNGAPFKDYHPVATLDYRGVAVAHRLDDFLFSDMSVGGHVIDFVFVVDRDHVMSADETKPPFHLPQGSYVEFKRYGVADLSGHEVDYGPGPNSDHAGMLYSQGVDDAISKTPGIPMVPGVNPAPSSPAASAGGGESPAAQTPGESGQEAAPSAPVSEGANELGDSGLTFVEITASNKLPAPINAGTGNDAATVQLPSGVGGELAGRKWQRLTVTADTPIKQLGIPIDDDISELGVDPNTVLVQVHCTAMKTGTASKMWAWGGRVADFGVADVSGHTYKCVGAWASVQHGSQKYMVVNYNNFDDKNELQSIPHTSGRPIDVWLAFEVPSGSTISEIHLSANSVLDNLNFKAQ
jgi:hypothetical protein